MLPLLTLTLLAAIACWTMLLLFLLIATIYHYTNQRL